MNRKTLGIYIHIPFCVQKCLYCDFVSSPGNEKAKKDYVNQLLAEIEIRANKECTVDTIFIGGGTPSVLDANEIKRILCKLKEAFFISKDCECSIEVNPGTVNDEKLKVYREAGVNRLSIGLQSCNDNELKALGRIHNYQVFEETYRTARQVGFDNINIDLMSSIPEQTVESFADSLNKVVQLGPEHISVYSLIVEEDTPFYNMDLNLPSEDEEREIYHETGRILKEAGYEQYEISNYAKPGRTCKHNIRYWKCGEYLGFGVAAASYLSEVRWKNTVKRDCYMSAEITGVPFLPAEVNKCGREEAKQVLLDEILARNLFYEEAEFLSEKEKYAEFMFMGLRMNDGVSDVEFSRRFGVKIQDIYGNIIAKHVKNGLLVCENGCVKLTDLGRDVSNYVMSDFLF